MSQNSGDYRLQTRKGKTEFAYYTFTPRPLMKGNFFEIDNELTDIFVTTYHTLGILEGMVKYVPNRESFTESSLLMECCYSRLIDYNDLSFYSALSGDSVDCIANIASAYKYSNGKAVTPSILSDLCKIALHGTETVEKISMRKKQIFMLNGVSNQKVYNPTAPEEIQPSMADISSFLSNTELTDALVKAALAHYQFETIHPFERYNGIVGRILISTILGSSVLSVPWIISISEFLYKNKNDYFDIISSTQHSGGYIRWIKFLLLGIRQAANQAIIRFDKYEKFIERDEALITSNKVFTKNDVRVYNYFKRHLVSKIKPISEELAISFNTASKSVISLSDIGILRMENKQSRHRHFRYSDVFDIFT